jgi:hypothetical protein
MNTSRPVSITVYYYATFTYVHSLFGPSPNTYASYLPTPSVPGTTQAPKKKKIRSINYVGREKEKKEEPANQIPFG